MTRFWGTWRSYDPGFLTSDDTEIDNEIVSQLLSAAGFKSAEEFNAVLGSYPRGELPEDLQVRLKAIFRVPAYTAEDVPDKLTISEGNVTTLEKPLVLQSPFRLAEGHEPLQIGIYAMSIEDDGGIYTVGLSADISSRRLFEAASEELEGICSILIDKLGSGASSDIDDEDRELLKTWLESNCANTDLVDDEDFLEELGMLVRFIVESIGITSIPFTNAHGDDIELYIEGDEEISFTGSPYILFKSFVTPCLELVIERMWTEFMGLLPEDKFQILVEGRIARLIPSDPDDDSPNPLVINVDGEGRLTLCSAALSAMGCRTGDELGVSFYPSEIIVSLLC